MLKLTLIAAGNKMPDWVEAAVHDFSKRLNEGMLFSLVEIPLLRRSKASDTARIMQKEMTQMKAAIPPGSRLIALDSLGESFTSPQLARKLAHLQQITSHVCFLIGGPEGLAPELAACSNEQWSLSKLTLPHPIARIVLLEALYRSWSILQNHPYHK